MFSLAVDLSQQPTPKVRKKENPKEITSKFDGLRERHHDGIRHLLRLALWRLAIKKRCG